MTSAATVLTPCGPFTVMVSEGAVVASGWTGDPSRLLGRPGEWALRPELGAITIAVDAYFDGEIGAIDDIPVRQRSGRFTERAWRELRGVAPGAPITYRELAARAGRPGAARAAGQACGANAAGLFVPCHRAVRGDGGLGGFRWGLAVKEWLLGHEAASGIR